ncbi:MAG: hypothetical protein GX879_07370 [Bacteroidales bacterium]|nr:hypothetical protein [Bacteroidales bacterium]
MFLILLLLLGSIGFFVIEHYCNSCAGHKFEITMLHSPGFEHEHGHGHDVCNQHHTEHRHSKNDNTYQESENCNSLFFFIPIAQLIDNDNTSINSNISNFEIEIYTLPKFIEAVFSFELNHEYLLEPPPLLDLISLKNPENTMSFRL